MNFKIIDIANADGYKWAVVAVLNKVITFTINDDNTLYLLNPDGSAMQDTEDDFMESYSDENWYEDILIAIDADIKKYL